MIRVFGTRNEAEDCRQPRQRTQVSLLGLWSCDLSSSVGEGRIMWPCIPRRRTLLMVVLLPLVCVTSMPLGHCVCSSGRTALVVGSRCVGCDCSCSRQRRACCHSSVRERSSDSGMCLCQHGCHPRRIDPTFTSAANFKWTPLEWRVWIDRVPPDSVRLNAVAGSILARHTILPLSHRYLEHNVLLL